MLALSCGSVARVSKGTDTSLRPGRAHTTGLKLEQQRKLQDSSVAKPNIVMLLADDLGWNQVGYQHTGEARVSTPIIDDLAARGIKLQRMYAHFICAPSRASLQSGRQPHHVLLENAYPGDNTPGSNWGYSGVPPQYEGLGSMMKRGGYKTYMLGKWHVGMSTPAQTPHGRGYDEALVHFASYVSGWTYMPGYETPLSDQGGDLWESGPDIQPPEGRGAAINSAGCNKTTALNWDSSSGGCEHMDDRLVALVEQILTSQSNEPIFLVFAPHTNHGPLDNPQVLADESADTSFTQRLVSSLTYLDGLVGRVVAALAVNKWDSTVLVFTSDNGASGEYQEEWVNAPLRGYKRTAWEGGIRVPAFVTGGFLPQAVRGTTQDGLMHLHDLYATFAAFAGVTDLQEAPGDDMFPMEGYDLSPLLLGTQADSPRTCIFVGNTPCGSENFDDCDDVGADGTIQAVIQLNTSSGALLKLMVGVTMAGVPASDRLAAQANTEHFSCGFTPDTGCLYDLNNDPGETTSIAAAWPTTFNMLLSEARAGVVYPNPRALGEPQKTTGYGPWLADP